jgi:hypothetical protein
LPTESESSGLPWESPFVAPMSEFNVAAPMRDTLWPRHCTRRHQTSSRPSDTVSLCRNRISSSQLPLRIRYIVLVLPIGSAFSPWIWGPASAERCVWWRTETSPQWQSGCDSSGNATCVNRRPKFHADRQPSAPSTRSSAPQNAPTTCGTPVISSHRESALTPPA